MSATTNLDGDAIGMAENPRPLEQMLDLTEEAPSAEHLDNQVQKAQEQLLQLKRQQEQIEKQKRELEELSRRQDELEQGRGEMTDKLTRALVVLEREAYNAQSRLEQIRVARESFAQHLELVEAIDPRNWNPSELHKELSRALSTVDDARTEYNEHRSRLQAGGGGNGEQSLPDAAPRRLRKHRWTLIFPMVADRPRAHFAADPLWHHCHRPSCLDEHSVRRCFGVRANRPRRFTASNKK